MAAYEAALRGNPGLADCHYNRALLCERLDKPRMQSGTCRDIAR